MGIGGAAAVTAALYRYGKPRRMMMLRSMMEQQSLRERRADYTANLVWSLTGAVFRSMGGEYHVPSWGEVKDGLNAKKPQEQSGEDIRDMLMQKWGGGE